MNEENSQFEDSQHQLQAGPRLSFEPASERQLPLPGHDEVFLDTLGQLLDNTPQALTDIFGAEDNTKQVYSDRFLFELLQNARDAAARGSRPSPRLRIEIGPNALLVANDGAPFDQAGFVAIKGISKSPKREGHVLSGTRLIGKKGIGFKSVLRVSRKPQIFANGPGGGRFAVTFGSHRVREICEAALDGNTDRFRERLTLAERALAEKVLLTPLEKRPLLTYLRQDAVDRNFLLDRLPVMKFPLWCDDVPEEVQKLLCWIPGGDDPFDTVIRLSLSADEVEGVRQRIREDVVPEKTLFLGTLAHIQVIDRTAQGLDRAIQAEWDNRQTPWTVRIACEGIPDAQVDTHCWKVFPGYVDVPIPGGACEKREILLGVPVDGSNQIQRIEPRLLFNYYPLTDEREVLPLLIHAEFEVDPGRTKFSADHEELNRALLNGIRNVLLGSEGLLECIRAGGLEGRAELPAMLVPPPNGRTLLDEFRRSLIESLRNERCVPDASGGWSCPSQVRMHPSQADLLDEVLGGWGPEPVSRPATAARRHRRFMTAASELRIEAYALADLLAALAAGLAQEWIDPARFRSLYRLLALLMEEPGSSDPLEPLRAGGVRPIPLVPCLMNTGDLDVLPLPRLVRASARNPGEPQTTEEILILYESGADDTLPPPANLRLRFLHPAILKAEPVLKRFIEERLGIRPYDTVAILKRLCDVDLRPEDAKAISRFVFSFVLRVGDDKWSLLQAVLTASQPQPHMFYHGSPKVEDSNDRAARRGLSQLCLPDASLTPRPAGRLRFTRAWGKEYEDLDALAPPSAFPLADPEYLSGWLDVRAAIDPIAGKRRTEIESLSEDRQPEDARLLLPRAFARLCGVWETVPVDYLADMQSGVSPDEVIERMPAAATLLRQLPKAGWNSYNKQETYRHQNTRITRTWSLRDLGAVSRDPERAAAFLRLLARDWDEFFHELVRLELSCHGCSHHGCSHKGTSTNKSEPAPPSVLLWQLQHESWYRPSAGDGEALDLSSAWLVTDPPEGAALQSSPWRYLPHIRVPGDAGKVFSAIGVPRFGDPRVDRYLDLLESLHSRFENGLCREMSTGTARVAFVALHREIWARLQILVRLQVGFERFDDGAVARGADDGSLFARHPQHFTRKAWDRLKALPTLAERDRSLVYLPVREALIDTGASSFARNLFRSEGGFSCVDERGRGLLLALGALEFQLDVTPDTGGDETDFTQSVQAMLESQVVDLVALLGRLNPGGGVPIELEGEVFRRRLARLRSCRYIHCRELRVVYAVRGRDGNDGRPVIHSRPVGEGAGDVHLDESCTPPRILFDVDYTDSKPEALLGALARPLAHVLEAKGFEHVFALRLRMVSDRREQLRFLEDLGIVDADLQRARTVLGTQDRASWDRRLAAVRAIGRVLERTLLPPPEDPGLDPNTTWTDWRKEAIEGAEGMARVAIEVADILPEQLTDAADNGPLARLEDSGFDLSRLSDALVSEGIESVHVRVHADRLRELRQRHFETVVTGLVSRGIAPDQARAAIETALRPDMKWRTRVRIDWSELCTGLVAVLSGARLPMPNLADSREEYKGKVANAVGLVATAFDVRVHETFSDEEREARQRTDFDNRRRALQYVMIALRLPSTDVRVEQIERVAEAWRDKIIFPGRDGDEYAPFYEWIRASGVPVEPDILLRELQGDAAISSASRILGRPELEKVVLRVSRFLDSARRSRVASLRLAYARHRGLKLTERIEPLGVRAAAERPQQTDSDGTDSTEKRKRTVRKGKVEEDEAERQRRGRLGAQGESIAFAWAVAPLVQQYFSDHLVFLQAARRLRKQLDDWKLPEELSHQFDAAVEMLALPDLEEEDLLEALQLLTHVSGDLASDGFGFDMIAWQPANNDGKGEVLLLEVKTSRERGHAFHLSRNQRDVAVEYGQRFAVLRVILPAGRNVTPELRMLIDPDALEKMPRPALRFVPETFEVTEV